MAAPPFVPHATAAAGVVIASSDDVALARAERIRWTDQPLVDGSQKTFLPDWRECGATLVRSDSRVMWEVFLASQRGAVAASAELIGLARRMLDMAVEYAKVRVQFGAPIGSFQAIKHLLADALLKIEFARPLVYRAAWSFSHGDPDANLHASMAKAQASDAASFVARVALQVHGAIGYTTEHDLGLWMKRAWVLSRRWGDAATHRRNVGQHLGIFEKATLLDRSIVD